MSAIGSVRLMPVIACAHAAHIPSCAARRMMRGVSLPAILIGLVLALAATVMASRLLLTARAAYAAVAEDTLIGEKGQQALEVITTQLRQSGWSPQGWPPGEPALAALANCGQATPGPLPTCTSTASTPGAASASSSSDLLQVRFAGSSAPIDAGLADETVVDCAGQGVPETRTPASGAPAGLSLFYIGRADDGEPQLLCRYPSRQAGRMMDDHWTSRSLIRGVEHLRFRFGVDDNGDGTPDRILSATDIGASTATWQRVISAQVALVVRAERRSASGPSPALTLFRNPDIRYTPQDAPQRLRKVFTAAVQLRNPPPCGAATC